MQKLRSVIIGCGAIFPMHAASIQANEYAQLVAVCDICENKAKARAQECNCRYYTDYQTMLEQEKPDSVHICLPHYLHTPVSIYALGHGCHVLCEKPMATTVEDAQRMIDAAQKSGKTLEIIFQNRYNPGSRLIKETVASGKLGKVLGARALVCWDRSQEYYSESGWRGTIEKEGGGVCVNQAIHTLDLMLWFCGKQPVSVKASLDTRAHEIEVEDDASGMITFDDSTRANFWFTNNYCSDAPVEVELICENGTAKLVGDKAEISFENGERLSAQNSDEVFSYGAMKNYWGVSHVKQINNYYSYLMNEEALFVDYKDAFETHKVMCAVLASGRENKVITL